MTDNKDDLLKKRYLPDEERLKKIIKESNVKELNAYAEELGNGLRYELLIEEEDNRTGKTKQRKEKELTTSQIRTVLDEIQRMHKFDENKLQLLRPKLAYAAGRHGGRVREFQLIVDKAILMVTNDNEFQNFKNFIEAIVAYHRYHGGE
ncbi:MAG: type III-A CRISPR-associated protein Csm2 [Nitrososphaeria archaeon]